MNLAELEAIKPAELFRPLEGVLTQDLEALRDAIVGKSARLSPADNHRLAHLRYRLAFRALERAQGHPPVASF